MPIEPEAPPHASTPLAQWADSPCATGCDLRRDCARYSHPRVRDIAWLLNAPDLLQLARYPRPSLAALGLEDDHVRHRWLMTLEQAPHALEAAVNERRHYRLGHYHELLWQFVLAHAPGSRLLANNLRISRGKITLGELDMLYLAARDTLPTHLEVAIKFYLGLPEGPEAADSPARWIGPGGADSLAIKYQRSLEHQLPLAYTERGQQTIRQALARQALARQADASKTNSPLAKDQPAPLLAGQQLALPGCLFRPWQPDQAPADWLPPPRHCHPESARQAGWWVSVSQFAAFCHTLEASPMHGGPLLGCVREKPAWLAAPPVATLLPWHVLDRWLRDHFSPSGAAYDLRPDEPVQQHSGQRTHQHPRQLWLERSVAAPDGEPITASSPRQQWRIFVVPDDWPSFIPLPPPPPAAQ
ncbi:MULTISPECIES: DUF1853 family protein [Cobetia]|uniref:DUF1853 family protein n=1 Tax=Cobetia TaxID=204286 RepID=UPI001583B88A|nr:MULTISPECIES: DUF1853 family protein [Cobetia]MDI4660718.1 DUF1853 family protein [Cobetia sp. BMC6]NUJ56676.1 DUF1853 family protein [Cobetia marina]